MLIDVAFKPEIVARAEAHGIHPPERIDRGLYHAGMGIDFFLYEDQADWRREWDESPFMDSFFWTESESAAAPPCYGTCDSVEQFLERYRNFLEARDGEFVVTFTWFTKKDHGSFRFHKNGPYIGEKRQGFEHFADEPDMEELLLFHIYEKLKPGQVHGWDRGRAEMNRRLAERGV
jgi:hypothetical protein